jgi:hypothetical protein
MNTNKENNSSHDSFENNLKISKPSERLLERQKRNKRRSKIYSERRLDNSHELLNKNESPPNINHTGRLFDFSDKENLYSMQNHEYTLELFQNLSIKEELVSHAFLRENIDVNSISDILKELSEERKENTTPNFALKCEEKSKTHFSQRFKDSGNSDPYVSKRFKV